MANPTSNFGWQMPTNTDLVKDLPADFEVFGQAVDTSLMDLKGGTTGQVLSKASNTDMDFTWVAQDDSNAIQNAIVDAKGDLITATAADTPARLAVGTNGQYLIADSTTATGLKWGDISAGAYTQLASGNLSGLASFSATSISSTYRQLVVELRSPRNGNGRATDIRINNNSNSIYTFVGTENLTWSQNFSQLDGNRLPSFFGSSNANDQNYGYLLVNNPSSGAMKMGYWQEFRGGPSWRNGWFRINDTNAITSISLTVTDSETWTGGTYAIYGVK